MGVTSAQRIKAYFLSNLWTWPNLYSVDNTNSLLDFFDLVGEYVGCLGLLLRSVGFFFFFFFCRFLLFFFCVCFHLVYV